MEIEEKDYNSIIDLINTYKKDDKIEFETRVFNNNSSNINNILIDHITFERVRNYLVFSKKDGGLGLKYKLINNLDIKIKDSDIRLTILGKDNIKKYWLNNKLEDIDHIFIKKKKLKNIDITDYNTRVSTSSEDVIKSDSDYAKKFISILNNSNKIKNYRFKNRYEIYDNENNFRIDLTYVRKGEGIDFVKSKTLKNKGDYEIEVECINRDFKDSNDMVNKLVYNISLLLSLIQDFSIITKTSDIEEVKKNYFNLIKFSNKNNNKFKGNKYENSYSPKFITASPVTIHPINLIKSSNNINILEPYAITPKADGERYLLYIAKSTNKKINGNMYLIDINMNVKFIGFNDTKWVDSLFEGEYISETNTIYIYDSLYQRGNDIRKKKFNQGLSKRSSNDKTRFEYVEEFLKNNKNIVVNLGDNNINIDKKAILYSNGENVFEKSKEIWDKKDILNFKIDGIIYIPLNDHYPIKGGSWHSLLKWKPSEYNSIDFLVRILKDDKNNDVIKPLIIPSKISSEKDKILRYKTAILYVGHKNDYYDNISKKWIKNIIPKEFNPDKLSDEEAINYNRAKIFINDQNLMIFKDPINDQLYELIDDTIAEFYYDDDSQEWKPLRIRYDKTEQYKNGKKIYGNFETTANDIWRSIKNPVTKKMLFDGIIDKDVIESSNNKVMTNKSYYKCIEHTDYDPKKRLPMQHFHNLYVKKTLISKYAPSMLNKTNKQTGYLLDLACGKSGDLSKWKNAKLKEVIAIDISKPCVEYGKNFYKTYPKPKPVVKYIWGDTSNLIWPNQDAGKSDMDKERMKEWIQEKYYFDVVSCQFCLHYYFESEVKLISLIKNISDNLKLNGYFIGTCFDGKAVFDLLKGKKIVEGIKDENVLWKITKDYKIRSFNANKPNFNQKINVFVKSIGETHTEYLVNFDYFTKIMKKYGFEIVEKESFENYYIDYEKNKNMVGLSSEEKKFSYLNNSFCYKKINNISEKEEKNIKDILNK